MARRRALRRDADNDTPDRPGTTDGCLSRRLSNRRFFLGLGSTLFSYLRFKSRYIPRALAALGIFSSLVLAIVTLTIMVFPALGAIGLTYMAPMFFYEVGLGLWLLVKGLQAPAVE